MESPTAPSEQPGFIGSLRIFAGDIKIAHSIFALPFALLAAVMAGEEWLVLPEDPDEAFWPGLWWLGNMFWPLLLIILAMVFARTVAMTANRLIDRRIDADNPRTARRALPSGQLSVRFAIITLLLNAALFLGVCVAFGIFWKNWWPTFLSVPVLVWISAYAYFKRFTWLCHFYLGSSLALSPLAAALAIHPPAIVHQPVLWFLSLMVLLWVAGFDVIYALQDVAVDQAQGLKSIPARFGVRGARWISRLLHLVAVISLIFAARVDERLGDLFAVGVGLMIVLLIIEHITITRWGTAKITLAFFTLNGFISCILGMLGIIDTHI